MKLPGKITALYHEYPRVFWIVVGTNFIDRLGGSLLFPFFALYITKRFDVGMSTVGGLFAIWSISSFVGGFLGGALTDRLGRKKMIVFSLVATSITVLALGLVNTLEMFFLIGFISGIFTDIGWPAYEAMIADILPEQKRAQGYSIIRVAFNLAVVIGPVIGGFMAARSYLALFIADVVISLISASIIFLTLPETKPEAKPGETPEKFGASFGGYMRVLKNGDFMLFCLASLFMALVYMNMSTTLGVFLRDSHSVPESGYGWILSLNATMVVLLQIPLMRRLGKYPQLLMIAVGVSLYAIGFAMYGFVSAFWLFLTAMAIITFGEMIVAPVTQAVVAKFAPEDMRGRYMAIHGYTWGLAFAVGPYLAGNILDHYNPNWLWFACGIIGTITALGFLGLHLKVGKKFHSQADQTGP